MDLLTDGSLYQLSLKLCRYLEFGPLIKESRVFLQQHTPVEKMVLVSFYPGNGLFSTIVIADQEGVRDIPERIKASPEISKSLSSMGAPVSLLKRASGSMAAKLMIERGLFTGDSSLIIMRMVMGRNMVGLLFCTAETGKEFIREHGTLFAGIRQVLSQAFGNCFNHRNVWTRYQRLTEEVEHLQKRRSESVESELIGSDMGLQTVMAEVRKAAGADNHIALYGESGSGRAFIAETIHSLSSRQGRPFTIVNVDQLPGRQLNDILFGSSSGRDESTHSDKGLLSRSSGGSVLIRGAQRLPEDIQKILVGAARNGEVFRPQSGELIKTDIRFVLVHGPADQEKNALVDDVCTHHISIPPLRHRLEDIPRLANYFLERSCRKLNRQHLLEIEKDCLNKCLEYQWPGNVRELELAVERAVLLAPEKQRTIKELLPLFQETDMAGALFQPEDDLNLDNLVANHIVKVLHHTKGKVGGAEGAAQLLGINPSTLRKRMRKLNVPFGRKAHYHRK